MSQPVDEGGSHWTRGLRDHGGMDREHLIEHLERALELVHAMDPIPEEETDGCAYAVSHDDVEKVAEAYGLLHDVHRHLPHVTAWVAGYYWYSPEQMASNQSFRDGHNPWSSFYGCATEAQAMEVAAFAREKDRNAHPHRSPSLWQARLMDIAITSVVRPDADPARICSGLYA